MTTVAITGIAGYQGVGERATVLLNEALAIKRKLGDLASVGVTLRYQAKLAQDQGEWARATARYQESLALSRSVGSQWEIAACLEGLGGVAAGQNRAERAARLWGRAETLRGQLGAPLPLADRAWYEVAVAHSRAVVGEVAFAAAWEKGRAMSLEQAIAYALEETPDA